MAKLEYLSSTQALSSHLPMYKGAQAHCQCIKEAGSMHNGSIFSYRSIEQHQCFRDTRYTRKTAPMSPSKNYGWWRVILSPSWHWALAFIASFANFLQCRSFGGFQGIRQIRDFTQVWWDFTMMAVIWSHHKNPN